MALYQPTRIEVLDELVGEVLHLYPRGRVLVGVDAAPDADWAGFAADWAERFRRAGHQAFSADLEDFARFREPSPILAEGDPADLYADGFDLTLLRRVLLEPFRLGGSTGFVTRAFDRIANRAIEPEWLSGDEDAVLIVAGPYLHREELIGSWQYSVWLDAEPPEVDAEPAAAEPAAGAAPAEPAGAGAAALHRARLAEGMARYRRRHDPRRLARATIDLSDPEAPRRHYADSC